MENIIYRQNEINGRVFKIIKKLLGFMPANFLIRPMTRSMSMTWHGVEVTQWNHMSSSCACTLLTAWLFCKRDSARGLAARVTAEWRVLCLSALHHYCTIPPAGLLHKAGACSCALFFLLVSEIDSLVLRSS